MGATNNKNSEIQLAREYGFVVGRIDNRAGGTSAYEFPNSPKEPPTSARRLPQNKNKSEDRNGMATLEKESLVRPILQKLMHAV